MTTRIACLLPALVAPGAPAAAQITDPLEARIERADAERFAALFHQSEGRPTADQLERAYLAPGGRAIAIFMAGRIENAAHLAAAIAERPEDYRRAIDTCLPWAAEMDAELRATYLGIKGLLPERALPEIALVFGAGNSGGTAAPGMQVLGLEVLCRDDPSPEQFRSLMRQFFAHETVHTLQRVDPALGESDAFLTAALTEGTADFIAHLVTASVPDPARDAWAREREAWVFARFAEDLAISRDASVSDEARQAALRRWFGNASSPPEGWPGELGYWVGMRIVAGFVAQARDPHAAIRQLLAFDDPGAILRASGLADRLGTPAAVPASIKPPA